MMEECANNIDCNLNTYEELIEYIRDNIIMDPDEFIESEEEIKRVAARTENIKLYRFISEIKENDELQELGDDIKELYKVLAENIMEELDFYDVLSCNGLL